MLIARDLGESNDTIDKIILHQSAQEVAGLYCALRSKMCVCVCVLEIMIWELISMTGLAGVFEHHLEDKSLMLDSIQSFWRLL